MSRRVNVQKPEEVVRILLQKVSYYLTDATTTLPAVVLAFQATINAKDLEIKSLKDQIEELKKKRKEESEKLKK